ncbi:MAG: hypothetical protein HZA88_04720 [Verrucomicrobia bacterium]|nr:hypothetical protein [Verrucomicrobiota bacterium]
MSETIIKVTREELYQQVWTTPMTQLAKKYEISSVALAKICRKLNVPRPGRGHWRRIQVGMKVSQPPLPEAGKSKRNEAFIRPISTRLSPTLLTPEMRLLIETESRPENRIQVPGSLRNPHHLICQSKAVFESDKLRSSDVMWSPPNQPRLNLWTSSASLPRALRIMDTLLKALEQRGLAIELNARQGQETRVIVGKEKVCIELRELADSIEQPAEEHWFHRRRSRLCFRIVEYQPEGGRKTWRDGKRYCLEDCLNEIVIGIMASAEAKRQQRLRWEEEERQRREEERRRQEEERLRQEEAACRKGLEDQAASWARSTQIRAFLKAGEQVVTERAGHLTPGSREAKWFEWAYRHADRLDPFKNDYFQPLLDLASAPTTASA